MMAREHGNCVLSAFNTKVTRIACLGWTGSAPKDLRLFVNEPNLSFEDVEDAVPAQVVTFTGEELTREDDKVLRITLKPIKFVASTRFCFSSSSFVARLDSL